MQYVPVAVTMYYCIEEDNNLYTKNTCMDSKQTVINTGVIKLNLKLMVFCSLTPCSTMCFFQTLRETCCFHHLVEGIRFRWMVMHVVPQHQKKPNILHGVKKTQKTNIWATPATSQVFGDVMLCPFVNSYWHFEGMLRQAATAWPWWWRHYDFLKYGNYSPNYVVLNSRKTWLFNFNIVHTVHNAIFNLSDHSYMHWNVNMTQNFK